MSTAYTPPFADQQSRGVSVPHLVMGLVFLGLTGSWALHEVGVIESVQVQWLLPLVLVFAGAAGLLATVARSTGRGTTASTNQPLDRQMDHPGNQPQTEHDHLEDSDEDPDDTSP